MKTYPLLYRSGGWVPDYKNYPPKDDGPLVYNIHEEISIPIDHPDLQALYRRHYKRPPKRGQFLLRIRPYTSTLEDE